MGQLKKTKIIIVVLCLLSTHFVISWQGAEDTRSKTKSVALAETLTSIGPWHATQEIPLAQNVVDELKLDDFIFRSFSNGKEALSLYIGYYYSSKLVGAAHDPLVCFPGQGWVLHGVTQDTLPMKIDGQDVQIRYSMMIAERDGRKEVLVYWFQAYDRAIPGTFAQKMSLLRSKFNGGGGGNAFVRISMSQERQTEKEIRENIVSFVEDFYPVFLNYIKQ